MKNEKNIRNFFLNIFVGMGLLFMSFLAYGDTNFNNSISQTVSDSAITAQIKAKYVGNPVLKVFDIKVETNDGVVKLTGLVDSEAQFERAIVLAESVDGVKNVDSRNLKTKSSPQPMSDTVITTKVKGMLVKNKLITEGSQANPWSIHVETKNGVVYLTGSVDNETQKNQVINTAKLIDGVKSVKADLKVK